MDENGMITDLELAKAILIEFFTTGKYEYENSSYHKHFINRIKNELFYNEDYYTFKDNKGLTYFGGPEGACGYWIQEVSEWIKWAKKLNEISVCGLTTDLNNENKVFYEIDGELKCFIIHEGD